MLNEKFKNVMQKLIKAESSPERLTLSFCLGSFIGWTPTIPFQTPLIILISRLVGLNATVGVTTAWIVNNPLFTVPVYVADYFFGVLVFKKLLGLPLDRWNPSWVEWLSAKIHTYVDLSKYTEGAPFCLWCLVLGGIFLPLIVSTILYFVMKPVFTKFIKRLHKDTVDENYNAE